MNYEQLKNSILQEAIEGRLVPQDPNDEPAAVLLDRIHDEKAKLVKEKKIKKDKNDSRIYRSADGHWMERFTDKKRPDVCIDDEIPFDIPETWEWCRLGFIVDFSKSFSVKASEIKDTDWILDLEDIEKETGRLLQKKTKKQADSKSDKHSFAKGNVLYSKLRPYLNKCIIADQDGYCTSEILAFDFRDIYNKYAQTYLMSHFFVTYAMSDAYGVKMPRLGSKQGNAALFPIPPLSEQHRIVEKLEQILPKVEEYGKAQERLDTLNAELPEKLKTSILQEAIEGRLVPQDPNDEPAAVLLDRIHDEKAKLVKEKKIKKDKNDSRIYRSADGHWMERFTDKKRPDVCIDDEIPFDIPETWEWCRLSLICQHNPQVEAKDDDDAAFMPMAYISNGLSNFYKYDIRKWKEIKNGFKRFKDGDMAFAKITPCFQNGKSFIAHDLPNHIGAGTTELHVMRVYGQTIKIEYLYFFIKSPYFMLQAQYKGTAGQQRVLKEYIDNKLFPLPPLSEQHRIVEKLESILPMLDAFKKR